MLLILFVGIAAPHYATKNPCQINKKEKHQLCDIHVSLSLVTWLLAEDEGCLQHELLPHCEVTGHIRNPSETLNFGTQSNHTVCLERQYRKNTALWPT